MQVRERLEHVSNPSHDFSSKETLAHNKEGNHSILQKKNPVWIIRRTEVLSASAGNVKHSLHVIHLSLLQMLGGNVHSKCSRSLEKTVDGIVVVGSV